MRSTANRPFKFGEKDRREFIVQDSEVAMRAENDASGNPIYLGRAKPGTATSENKWQISLQAFDGNNSLTSKTWPQNDDGLASSDYDFTWDDRATYTYS